MNTHVYRVATRGLRARVVELQLLEGALSEAVDAYAFGAVLWELDTQSAPWGGGNSASLIYSVVHSQQRLAFDAACPAAIAALATQCMCHDPQGAQAANLVEQLIKETIGEGFIGSSFLGIVAYKNCQPQGLHQDQGMMHMGGVQSAPWSMNTMYVLDDFTAENGCVSRPSSCTCCSPVSILLGRL